MKTENITEDIKAYQKKYREKNKEKYKEYHREYHKKWREKHDKKIKEELKKIKEEMNFKNMHNDVLKEIEKDVFVNVANNNKGSLFQNGLGQWYYQIEYSCDRETYISEFFDRKDKAMKDMRVAI